MKSLKVWLKNVQRSWTKTSEVYMAEDFEISEFDHVPFIDEAFKNYQQRTIGRHFPKAS